MTHTPVLPAACEARSEQEEILNRLIEQGSQLFRAFDQLEPYREAEFSADTIELLQDAWLVQRTLLEERLHTLRPELHPRESQGGHPYSHRREAIMHLKSLLRRIERSEVLTIPVRS